MPLTALMARANRLRARHMGMAMDLCTITNAKSGLCSEDCKFCAQSGRHKTGIAVYPLKSIEQMFQEARQAKANGAKRFGIVTSGNRLTKPEIDTIAETIKRVRRDIGIGACASLGELEKSEFLQLKRAGLSRYHHNLETSREYFPKLVTTHTFNDRIKTIKAAKAVGLEVCSGGIIGLGESMQDRISMALTLKALKVDSVPINVLMPIAGTRMAHAKPLPNDEVIRTIAIFRIILKDKVVKIAAGRESALKDFQALAFMAGANGMLVGGYLTTRGRAVIDDQRLVEEVKRLWMA